MQRNNITREACLPNGEKRLRNAEKLQFLIIIKYSCDAHFCIKNESMED